MSNVQRADFLTRNSILSALTDDEVASVCKAESAAHLANGEEFVDLAQLAKGVRSASTSDADLGTVLPRSAVPEATWQKIVGQLNRAAQAPTA